MITAGIVLATGASAALTAACLMAAVRALWRPVALVDTARLVRLHSVEPLRAAGATDNALPDVSAVRDRARSLNAVASYLTTDYNLSAGGRAVPIRVTFASHHLWTLARVPAALGRTFGPEHDRPGGDLRKVVLSAGLWRTMFGSDPTIVRRSILLGTAAYEVLGVMPDGYAFPDRADAWLPLESWLAYLGTSSTAVTRGARSYAAVAAIGERGSDTDVGAELDAISSELSAEFPASNRDLRIVAVPFARSATAGTRASLFTALAASVVLSLTAMAAILLVRGASRRQRLRTAAIQVALGATRWHLVAVAARDASRVALVSGSLAAAGSAVLTRAIAATLPLPHPVWLETRGSATTALVALLLGSIPILLAAVVEAIRIGPEALAALNDRHPRRTTRMQHAGAGLQLAIAAVLIMAGVAVLAEVQRLRRIDPGFVPDATMAVFISPPGDDVVPAQRGASYASFYDRVLENVRREPGIVAAGAVNVLPLRTRSGWQRNGFTVFAQEPAAQQWNPLVNVLRASGGYFEAMQIPLLAGRDFDERDRRESARVAIVNRALAERMWPNQSALGRQLKLGNTASTSPWATIVGIVGDVRSASLSRAADYDIYVPYRQVIAGEINFVVRSRLGKDSAVAAVERAVHEANVHAAVFRREALTSIVEESLWQQRISMVALAAFAVLALLIAAGSVFGLVAAAVSARRRELAVRAALGADGRRLALLVIAEAAAPLPWAAAGFVALALGARLLLAAVIEAEAVPVQACVIAIGAVLSIVAIVIAGPARIAMATDPALTLREDPLQR